MDLETRQRRAITGAIAVDHDKSAIGVPRL
jgi:hypothetical protein